MTVDDKLALSWWPIYGFDNTDWQNRKFAKFERADRYGFCVASASSYENKKIKAWVKRYCQDFSYISRMDECPHHHSLIGSFNSPSCCIWLDRKQFPAFHTFLQSLPIRVNEIRCGAIDPIVSKMLRGLNYCVYTGLNEDLAYHSVISVEDYDNIEHLKFLLAITR